MLWRKCNLKFLLSSMKTLNDSENPGLKPFSGRLFRLSVSRLYGSCNCSESRLWSSKLSRKHRTCTVHICRFFLHPKLPISAWHWTKWTNGRVGNQGQKLSIGLKSLFIIRALATNYYNQMNTCSSRLSVTVPKCLFPFCVVTFSVLETSSC